ncbi:hypothetical protein Cadr_000014402, partial [Camelus dromedarius]
QNVHVLNRKCIAVQSIHQPLALGNQDENSAGGNWGNLNSVLLSSLEYRDPSNDADLCANSYFILTLRAHLPREWQ